MEITQCELLLKTLKGGRKLTGVEIINELFILNYTGRIFDLRKKGHLINTTMVKTKGGAMVAQYFIPQPVQGKLF